MENKIRRLKRLSWFCGAFFFAGIAVFILPTQDYDPGWRPRIAESKVGNRSIRVGIDEAHWNAHTAENRFRPLARLLDADGYRVSRSQELLEREGLSRFQIFVIANALGFGGSLRQLLGRDLGPEPDPFTDAEIAVVKRYVEEGGSLLLVADHSPAGNAARKLASVFGVEMSAWWAEDQAHADPSTKNPMHIRFDREARMLGEHPIMDGVSCVLTFSGQSLSAPAATPLLRFSATAREYPNRVSNESEGRSLFQKSQAIALDYGRGRVVVLGEAACVTAQIAVSPQRTLRFGMNRAECENQLFARNIAAWLARLI